MRLPDPFNLIARFYDRLMGQRDDSGLISLLDLRPGEWLLDVGGGTGRVAEMLVERGTRVVVCDRSRGMLEVVRSKGMVGVQASVTNLPFAAERSDAVLVVDAFHHFTQPSANTGQFRAAQELARVLRPGGRLVIEEPDIRHMAVKAIALGEIMLLMRSRFLPPTRLKALVQSTGCRLESTHENGISAQMRFGKGFSHHDEIVQQPHPI